MRRLILLTIAMPAALALAQDDVLVQDDGSDARLRGLTETAVLLSMERVELEITPPLELGQVSSISADAAGNLYILHRGNVADPIIVTDRAGRVLRSFGRGLFNRPHSIRLDPAGNVWTVDSNTSMIYKFSPSGEKLLEISVGDVPDSANESCAASDIAFGTNGQVYVADGYCNARVVVYDAAGRKVREWGGAGTGSGEFDLPHGISVSPEGNVYVADRENGRVQWFTPEGEYLGEWQYGGRVLSVVFSSDGELYISAEPKGAVPQQEGTLLKINRADGSIVGKIEAFGHELGVGADGTLLPASLYNWVVVYRP